MNLSVLSILLLFCASVHACTAFQLKSQDGASIYCRSLEFGFPMNSNLLIVPRESSYAGTTPAGKPGLKWRVKYGHVGMNQSIAPTFLSDGMNEKGVVVGCLYLPGYAKYEDPDPKQTDKTLGAWELTSYLLGTCSSLDDVKGALKNILVAQENTPGIGDFVIPLHFYVSDATGAVLIVEYVGGKRMEYDDPLGVLTNSPPFDWQQINLSNFINLSPVNVPQLQLSNFDVRSLGQGTGLLGIPGDYTPPSRFVRATLFSQWALPQKTALETVRTGFHILNTFDIFEGIVRDVGPKANPLKTSDFEMTEWIIVHDKTNLKTYFRSYKSLQIQMADLKNIDFAKPGFRTISLKKNFEIIDETTNALPLL